MSVFRKPFQTGVENKISGADRKKIRRHLAARYPSLSEDSVEELLPNKTGELESVKLAAPKREIIYKLDGIPIFIDPNGKGDYMPTIFSLWKVPNMVPQIFVKHPAVTRFIVSGADLMIPGVLIPSEGLPVFREGALVSICVVGNPAPLAIGSATMDSSIVASRKAGKLVEVRQAYGDMLWDSMGRRAVPNEGYCADGVLPIDAQARAVYGSDEGDEEDEEGEDAWGDDASATGQHEGDGGAGCVPADGRATAEGPKLEQKSSDRADEAPAGCLSRDQGAQGSREHAGSVMEEEGGGEGAACGPAMDVPEIMDELLEMTLLQALTRRVKDEDLPMNASIMWNTALLPARPAGVTLDLKKSRHKKLGAFFKAYGAKGGILSLKEDKYSGEQVVVRINRDHDLLTEYRPYRASLTAGRAEAAEQAVDSSAGGADGPRAGLAPDDLIVEEVYRPGRELKGVFEAVGVPLDRLLTASEAGDVAFEYVKHAKLTPSTSPEKVILDVTLCDALFKGLIKKGEMFPSEIPRSELRSAFLRRCHAQCRISRGSEVAVRKGSLPAVNVSVEKRQGNKRVTRIVGVEPFLIEPDALSSELARRFAASCTVNELPGHQNKGHEIILQGSFLEKIPTLLTDKYKIPKKYVSVKK